MRKHFQRFVYNIQKEEQTDNTLKTDGKQAGTDLRVVIQKDRQAETQTQTDRQKHRHRQADRLIERKEDRQIKSQTERHTS